MSMARPEFTPEQRNDIESDIRNTARHLFARDGYRNVSLRAIARETGRSATALYRYYDSKDALLASLRVEGFALLQASLEAVRATDQTPEAAISGAMTAYLRFAREHSELFRLMFELDQGDLSDLPHVTAARRRAFASAIALAEDLVVAGGSGDANQIAHILWVGMHGLASLALAHQLDLGQSYDQLAAPLTQTLFRGMSAGDGRLPVALPLNDHEDAALASSDFPPAIQNVD